MDLRNPLLERDFLRLVTRPGVWRSRTIAIGLTALVGLLVAGSAIGEGADTAARDFHGAFTLCALVFLAFQCVGEAALALPTERATGALPVLLTAPRSPLSLAFGFLGARWLQAGYTVLGLLPVGGIVFLLGGVGLDRYLLTMYAAVIVILQGSAFGFLGGVNRPDARSAYIRGAGYAVFWWFLCPLLIGMTLTLMSLAGTGSGRENLPEILSGILGFLLASGPIPAAQMAMTGAVQLPPSSLPWVSHPLLWAGGSTLSLVALSLLVGARRLAREDEWNTVSRSRGSGAVARPSPVVPEERPLVWRESRPVRGFKGTVQRWSSWIAFVGYMAIVCWLAWILPRQFAFEGSDRDGWRVFLDILMAIPVWGFPFVLYVTAGTWLPEQRERSTLDLLYALPLPAWHFGTARAEVLLRRWRPRAIAWAVLWMAAVLSGRCTPAGVPLAVFGAAMVTPLLLAASLRLGSFAGSAREATRRLGFGLFAMIFLFPVLLGILATVTRSSEMGYLTAANPLVAMVCPFISFHADHADNEFFAVGFASLFLGLGVAAWLWRGTMRRIREEGNLGGPGGWIL